MSCGNFTPPTTTPHFTDKEGIILLFNSYIFVLLFLPVAVIGYYTINRFKQYRAANFFLIGMSLWFYGYFNPSYLLIICGSIVVNYLVSRGMEHWSESVHKKAVLIFGICVNITVIFYFKYFDFFIENVNAVFGSSFELRHIVLPLGISFFTFQQISYLVDSYCGKALKEYTFDEYALFVTFFPQLIAGPIVLHSEMAPQFRNPENRRINPENFAKGLYIFALGLFKKVIIADTFATAVNFGFDTIETLSSLEAVIISVSYTFQIFFDFSGYCDMAIGIGCLFNVELPQNFNSPYKADSIPDFWDRWHMTLTRFLRTYIYIPLGGNRRGKLRTYLNIMVVFLVSGIWHGANWTFVLWGVLHGVLNCLTRLFQKDWNRLDIPTRRFVTFSLVNGLWILFRADNINSASLFVKRMFLMADFSVRPAIYNAFALQELQLLAERLPVMRYLVSRITGFPMWIFLAAAFFSVFNFRNSKEIQFRPTIARSLIATLFIVWSVMSFAGISTFIYFNF